MPFAETGGAMANHATVEPGFTRVLSVDTELPARDQARHCPGGCNMHAISFLAVLLPGWARRALDACATCEQGNPS